MGFDGEESYNDAWYSFEHPSDATRGKRAPKNNRGRSRQTRRQSYAAKAKQLSTEDMTGQFVEFSMDQRGSRTLQSQIQKGTDHDRRAIFEEIQGHILQLVTDAFGNYVVQKLFEHGAD